MRWFKSKNSSFAGSFFYSTKKNNEFGMPASMVGSALINAVKVSAIPLPASMAMSAALNITRAVNMPMPASMAGSSLVTLSSFTGLLDDYPNAAAAYSIRKLRADYTGALLELRRSDDNALKEFYPDANNEFSLNSEDGAGTTVAEWVGLNDAFVRTWFDQSGNANNAQQTSASSQPKIINSGALILENGKTALSFNGSNVLFSSTITPFAILTFSCVVAPTTTGKFIFDSRTGANSNSLSTFSGIRLFNNTTGITQIDTLAQNLYSGLSNGASSLLRRNTNQVTGSIGTNTMNGFTLGDVAGSAVPGLKLIGTAQEYIFYSNDNSANISGIETNQNEFYSIY